MKILQILPELNVGGVETGTVDLAKYLVEKGHYSVVVSNGGELVKQLESAGAKHYVLPVHKKSLLTIYNSIKSLRKIIRKEKIDIVHARSRVPAWIAYFATRKTNASFITTCHGYYKNRFFSQVMGWAKLIIVPSEVIGRHMIDDYKVQSRSIRCIPRSVDLDKFKVQKEFAKGSPDKVVAIVGRITPLKGHIYFLKAMATVVRSNPYLKIQIIGDVPAKKESYKRELEVLVKRLGIKDNVEFLGNRSDVPELLSKVDVLVLATITQESFGRVIIEAQAVGVPVVATKVGGVVDIIDDDKTGLLVMPKDTESMAKAVLRLLNDKTLAARFSVEAKKKLQEKYTLDQMATKTIEVYEELLRSMNILVIKMSSVGDVVMVTPSLKALRKKFPKARIHCLVGNEARKILHNCPYLDGLIVYDKKHKDRGPLKFLKLASKLRKYRFDKIIDFQNNGTSHLLSFLSFPNESYGFNNGKYGFLLSHPVKNYIKEVPAIKQQFQILSKLDINYNENSYLELWLSAKDKQHARQLFDSEWMGNATNIVGINIAASAKWQTKNWPIDYIAKLCDLLTASNIRVIITGMDHDRELAQKLLSLTKSKPAIFVGKTDIMQLAALIKQCKVFVTPDSAPMHVAADAGTPFIAFFGPTDAERHLPPAKKYVVLDKKLNCAPCYSGYCKILSHACIDDISPEEVMKEIKYLMS